MNEIENLAPELLWKHFSKLCEIPRPSKYEDKVVEYIEGFARENKLDYSRDSVGNIIIRKSASSGMEKSPIVVLQSHVDMVPQKNNDKNHDFLVDPITPVIDGDWVRADKTTLGADNGIGVASMLAILESDNIKHGPVEALFTIDEETGMTGAFELSDDFVKGRILLNLDTEDENEICIGCAGGMDTNIKFHYLEEPVPNNMSSYEIVIKGLQGGHSGIDIHLERGNAIKILTRILWQASKIYGLRLSYIEGGNMRNAIPRESKAVVVVEEAAKNDFITFFKEKENLIKTELKLNEPALEISITETEQPYTLLCSDIQHKLLNALYACPNGVIRMSKAMPGVVETSTNLAIVHMEDGIISVNCLLRSAINSAKRNLGNMIDSVFTLAGADVSFEGEYPGWTPDTKSSTLNIASTIYSKMFGKQPEIVVVHAGLECGIIGAKYSGIDMISFGPTIKNAHSPDEKVNIKSVGNYWNFLLEVLKNIK